MSETMKKVIFQEVGKPLSVVEGTIPVPGEGQLLLRVKACGICGSDLHLSHQPHIPAEAVFGHEFSGEVVAVGTGNAGDWQPGDRAVTIPLSSCGSCAACLKGNPKGCPTMLPIGLGHPDAPGAYAEYICVPANSSIKMAESLSWTDAACIEPFAVGLYTIRRANIRPSENVLILGAGPIGLTATLWAKFCGAGKVVVSEPVPHRMELASKMGADVVLDPTKEEDILAAYIRETGTVPDIIIESVGVPGLIQQCIHIAVPGSRIVVAGVCMEADTIMPMEAVMKDLTLTFLLGYEVQDFHFALQMASEGRIDPSVLLTDQISLDEVPEAFEALRTPNTQCKVVVVP